MNMKAVNAVIVAATLGLGANVAMAGESSLGHLEKLQAAVDRCMLNLQSQIDRNSTLEQLHTAISDSNLANGGVSDVCEISVDTAMDDVVDGNTTNPNDGPAGLVIKYSSTATMPDELRGKQGFCLLNAYDSNNDGLTNTYSVGQCNNWQYSSTSGYHPNTIIDINDALGSPINLFTNSRVEAAKRFIVYTAP